MVHNLGQKLKQLSEKEKPSLSPRHEETACWARDEYDTLDALAGLDAVTPEHARMICGLKEAPPFDIRRALFVDTETTGLRGAGTVAFLIGAGWLEGERFVTRQLLMRDYPQEESLLSVFADMLGDAQWLVTFNGKSFDIPLLRDRFIMNQLRGRWRELPHIDLLHASRRVWKPRLERCSLQRLETELLGIGREGDIPGEEIPQRYFDYLKTRDFSLLADILEHNAQDVRSMARLLVRLADAYDHAEDQDDPLDIFALGRSLNRAGDAMRARECYKAASTGAASEMARFALADSYRQEGAWHEARLVFEQMTMRGEGGIKPFVAMAKIAEHRQRDPSGALTLTRQAIMQADPDDIPELERRRERLLRKLEGGKLR